MGNIRYILFFLLILITIIYADSSVIISDIPFGNLASTTILNKSYNECEDAFNSILGNYTYPLPINWLAVYYNQLFGYPNHYDYNSNFISRVTITHNSLNYPGLALYAGNSTTQDMLRFWSHSGNEYKWIVDYTGDVLFDNGVDLEHPNWTLSAAGDFDGQHGTFSGNLSAGGNINLGGLTKTMDLTSTHSYLDNTGIWETDGNWTLNYNISDDHGNAFILEGDCRLSFRNYGDDLNEKRNFWITRSVFNWLNDSYIITGGASLDDTYLAIDGSNANTAIDLQGQNLNTSGYLRALSIGGAGSASNKFIAENGDSFQTQFYLDGNGNAIIGSHPGSTISSNSLNIAANKRLRFLDYDGNHYVSLKSHLENTIDLNLILPNTDGSAYQKLITDGSGNMSWSYLDFSNTRVVDQTGINGYTSIQDAIDSISDNSVNKPYSVLIYPGIYIEDIYMEDYVSLVGIGNPFDIVIYGVHSTPLILFDNDNSSSGLYDLTLYLAPIYSNCNLIDITNGIKTLYNINLIISSSTNDITSNIINMDGGYLYSYLTYTNYTMTGSHVNNQTHILYDFNGSITYFFALLYNTINIADINDTVYFIKEYSGNTINSYFENNHLYIEMNNNSYDNILYPFDLSGNGTIKIISHNFINLISSNTGTCYLYTIDSSENSSIIRSKFNDIYFSGFEHNLIGNIGAGDTINSIDSLNVELLSQGAGTLNAINFNDETIQVTSQGWFGKGYDEAIMVVQDLTTPEQMVFRNCDINITQHTNGKIFIASGIDVGLGTNTPRQILHIDEPDPTGNSYLALTNGDSGSGATDGIIYGYAASNLSLAGWNKENTTMLLGTNNTRRYTIEADGDLIPEGTKALDCGNVTEHFDDVYADDFQNTCEMPDISPSEALDKILLIRSKDRDSGNGEHKKHIDYESLPNYVRAKEKKRNSDGSWSGAYWKDGKKAKLLPAKDPVTGKNKPAPENDRPANSDHVPQGAEFIGEYENQFLESYSINDLQIYLLYAIQEQQKIIEELQNSIEILENQE